MYAIRLLFIGHLRTFRLMKASVLFAFLYIACVFQKRHYKSLVFPPGVYDRESKIYETEKLERTCCGPIELGLYSLPYNARCGNSITVGIHGKNTLKLQSELSLFLNR